MINKKPDGITPYFPIFRCLKQGGLSIWLNRFSLLPLSLLPIIVTFVTLTVLRSYNEADLSPLTLAIIQIPADLIIGLYCALIIMIIMAAPKEKKEGDAPMAFSINLKDKKNVMIAAAIAHTLFGYLFLGGFAIADLIMEPLRAAETQEQINPILIVLLALLGLIGLYVIRFNLLPVLIIGETDIKSFFLKYKMFGLSLPILFTKLMCLFSIGFVAYLPLAIFGMAPTPDSLNEPSAGESFFFDLFSAISAVISYAWMYASLAYGVRLMIENNHEIDKSV